MARNLLTVAFFLLTLTMPGQMPVGAWADHLSYSSATCIAIGRSEIYASAGSGILVYRKQYNELDKITRVEGLTETSVGTIAWSDEQEALIIAYTSTNIDIIRNNQIANLPDIKRKYIPGKKEVFRIRSSGNFAYMATSFGLVVVDILKNEVYDTWKPGNGTETAEVNDFVFSGGRIYAATSMGVYYADASNPGLSYYGNWKPVNGLPVSAGSYNAITESQGRIYVNRRGSLSAGDSVLAIGTGVSLFSYQNGVFNSSLEKYDGGFLINSNQMVRIYSPAGNLVKTISSYNPGLPDIAHSAAEGSNIWIADISSGLVYGQDFSIFTKLLLPGPFKNDVISVRNSQGRTYIAGGGVDNAWNNQWKPLQIYIHENNSWINEYNTNLKDAMRILPDPDDRNHYWVSTWGMGLLEYRENTLKNKYDYTNSPLQTIIPGQPYVRIAGLAYDSEKNIWITHSGVEGSIKVLKADGSWITFPVTIEAPTIGDIIITRSGTKWIVLPRGRGLFVLDDNKTTGNFTDDRWKQFLVKDADNKVISNIYSIAEDMDGSIWVGTDQGPAIYYDPARIFDSDPKAYRIKVPRDDGSGLADYMLGTEIITSIAVDGANRKWIGTASSGVYLLSEDGTKRLQNYTEENSPLLSNTIASMDIDDKNGEVWIGTAKGVISIRGNSTMGGTEFTDVYAFPNPVRESYQGNVTITGLMRNTQIRITDVSGNLVYRTISDGGQATWDLTTYNGERVSTGVYLVFCASEDGTSAVVTKLLVIK